MIIMTNIICSCTMLLSFAKEPQFHEKNVSLEWILALRDKFRLKELGFS